MSQVNISPSDTLGALPRIPSWATSTRAKSEDEIAFQSGAALALLHTVLACAEVPQALLRERLALRAAEANVRMSGRFERIGELRDEVHLLRPGDTPGPAGAIYMQWRRVISRQISLGALSKALPDLPAQDMATWLDMARGSPIRQATAVFATVLAENKSDETVALILADAALSRACGWKHLVPLLALGLRSRDLRCTGSDLHTAIGKAIIEAATEAVTMARDLAQRSARLEAARAKLRAKGAEKAVALFLSRDALAPMALNDAMSGRAARRFCQRLVDLGVVRELTGRDTFRIYGV
ncbi:DUF1403 family protein [Roseobacter sp. EG26]|uniref:DUF1403 family protein n=1 Tax=Roseobacter sp. EG26 TaxID=3412477 RepID=UPI003CE58969